MAGRRAVVAATHLRDARRCARGHADAGRARRAAGRARDRAAAAPAGGAATRPASWTRPRRTPAPRRRGRRARRRAPSPARSSATHALRMRASGVIPRRPRSSTHHAARPRRRASSPIDSPPAEEQRLAPDLGPGRVGGRRPSPRSARSWPARACRGSTRWWTRRPSGAVQLRDADRRRRHAAVEQRVDGQRRGVARRPATNGSSMPIRQPPSAAPRRRSRCRRRRRGAGPEPLGERDRGGRGAQRSARPLPIPPLSTGAAGMRTSDARGVPAGTRRDRPAAGDGGGPTGPSRRAPVLADPLECVEHRRIEPAAGQPAGPVDGSEHRPQPPRDERDPRRSRRGG